MTLGVSVTVPKGYNRASVSKGEVQPPKQHDVFT